MDHSTTKSQVFFWSSPAGPASSRRYNQFLRLHTKCVLLPLVLVALAQSELQLAQASEGQASEGQASEGQASEGQASKRSAFEYHDGSAIERRPYRHPRLDVDPTDLTVEELKERLSRLEDRIERLENSLRSAEARP